MTQARRRTPDPPRPQKSPPAPPSDPVLLDQLLSALIALEADLTKSRDEGKITKRECGLLRSLVLTLHDRLEDASHARRP